MKTLLLVDDDLELSALLKSYLEAEGFSVMQAFDGKKGLELVKHLDVDLMVLDIMMPGMDGIQVLQQLRQNNSLPVIMLTAKGDDVDRIIGLEVGADDYLPKPCNPRELVARIRAIFRRSELDKPGPGPMQFGDLLMEPAARRASWNEQALDLTSTEYNLLWALMQNSGQVVSKSVLSEMGLNRKFNRYDRSIDMHISHLRKKLERTAGAALQIMTIRNQGYQLVLV